MSPTTEKLMASVAFAAPTQPEPKLKQPRPEQQVAVPDAPPRKPRRHRTVHRARRESSNEDGDEPDQLVPDPMVWREFGISSMTGWRWTHDPELAFPPPIKIRNRCFRSRRALEEFKGRMMRASIAERRPLPKAR